MEITIRPIQDGDNLRWIKLGSAEYAPLKTFLSKSARSFHTQELAKTYVAVESQHPNRVGAYLTLVCSEIQNSFNGAQALAGTTRFRYDHLPATKLARMAVDERWKALGLRIGSSMMDWCIAHVMTSIMPHVGCRFLVVDAKVDAVGFYEKAGFRMLDTDENRASGCPVMFIDLAKVQQRIERENPEPNNQPDLGPL